MSGLSTSFAQSVLNLLRGTNITAPTGVYVALYNGDPGDAGVSGTDVTTQVRAAGRVEATFAAPSGKTIANDAEVAYGPSDSSVNITHFGLWDAQSAGNFLGGYSLQTARSIVAGDPVSFQVGDLSVVITP